MISFSITDNENIRKFLEGDDSHCPISEFMYVHTRPLLRPNFLTEIGDIVDSVSSKIEYINLTGKPIDDLSRMAKELGKNLDGEMTETKAREILMTLRNLRNLCLDLDKNL